MRILEKCTKSWLMPEMQTQIESLREAFSADTSKPFQLKHSFPYDRTPPPQPNPTSEHLHYQQEPVSVSLMDGPISHPGYVDPPITPPISTGTYSAQGSSPHMSHWNIPNQHQHQQHHDQQAGSDFDMTSWNPSRIFEFVYPRLFFSPSH
jgi:hypothetical protein